MIAEISLLDLFLQAGLFVKGIMLLLLLLSLMSWTVIYQRALILKRAQRRVTSFENAFWSGIDLAQLYDRQNRNPKGVEGAATIFQAGFKEYIRIKQQKGHSSQSAIEVIQRHMRAAFTREMDRLDHNLSFLATVGSVSPYIGLLGTVWGIMHAFIGLAGVQQATMAMVAPGIAEALVATAMGLLAAIPAVVAYNRYAHFVARLSNRYEAFQEEFSSILQRQVHAQLEPSTTVAEGASV